MNEPKLADESASRVEAESTASEVAKPVDESGSSIEPACPSPEVKARRVARQARFWAMFPVGILVLMFLGLGTMAVIALDDPSFALEKDYYKKALAWDDTAAQRAKNIRLGWRVDVQLLPKPGGVELVAKVVDRDGKNIEGATVDVEAFHNARAADIIEGRLKGRPRGQHRLWLPLRKRGLWELRVLVQRGDERFTTILRRDAPGV